MILPLKYQTWNVSLFQSGDFHTVVILKYWVRSEGLTPIIISDVILRIARTNVPDAEWYYMDIRSY